MKGPPMGAGGEWIDISLPLKNGMVVYPGDPPVVIEGETDVARGDATTLSRISMGLHSGTHVDAPLHLFEGGLPVDLIPLGRLTGIARVIAIRDEHSIGVHEIEPHLTGAAGIILFKTRNSALWSLGGFSPGYVSLSAPAARYLAKRGAAAVGIDYLSIDGFGEDNLRAHSILLDASIPIIEGLDLSRVGPGL
ncbi:MAG: cyclase family protein [Syntrophorhabdales bacterium]